MKTYNEVIVEKNTRNRIESALKNNSNNQKYYFEPIPLILYKYGKFKSYQMENIEREEISFSPIGDFNDLYDSTIHVNPKYDEIKKLKTSIATDEIISSTINVAKKFNEKKREMDLQYLSFSPMYASCFSKIETSVLMWSHYSDEHQGICLGYNFNSLSDKDILKQSIFNVMYSDKPVDLFEYMQSTYAGGKKVPDEEIDIGLGIAMLTKAAYWEYEHEWRILLDCEEKGIRGKHIQRNVGIKPSEVCLGHHFLKNFFPIEGSHKEQEVSLEHSIKLIIKLLEVCENNPVSLYYMDRNVGSYSISKRKISIYEAKRFFQSNFDRCQNYEDDFILLKNDFLKCLVLSDAL
jgi:hypothetical protein